METEKRVREMLERCYKKRDEMRSQYNEQFKKYDTTSIMSRDLERWEIRCDTLAMVLRGFDNFGVVMGLESLYDK